jgi:hypothetical protein
MQAYEGYLEDGRFTPIGKPVNIHGRRRVVLTVFDETLQPSIKERELRAVWLKRLDAAISLAIDEDLQEMTRSALMREPLNLAE